MYRSTWNGFWTSKGFFVEDPKQVEQDRNDAENMDQTLSKKKNEIVENVKRNVEFVSTESDNIRKQVREATGIDSKEDLRKFAGDMMKLASECVQEFMAGYRKGRDDETEKMITQYFKDLEEEANLPKRRKRKRRVLVRT